MKKSELNQLIKEILSEDIFLQNRKSPEEKAKRLEQELDLEYKAKFGVEVYKGNIKLTKQILPYFKKYSKIKKVIGYFYCDELGLESLTELSIPEEIEKNFNCLHNDLTTLTGAPKYVGGNFDCSLSKLTSLKGASKYVGGHFICKYNNLRTLEGAPEHVGRDFSCTNNNLTTLKGAPKYVGGSFGCYKNSIQFTEEDVRKFCDVKGNVYI